MEKTMESERKRRIKILLEKLENKIIYLYGAGKRGKIALENLDILGFGQNVAGFIDDEKFGGGIVGEKCLR